MALKGQIKDYDNSFVWLNGSQLADFFKISRNTFETYRNVGRVNRLFLSLGRSYYGIEVPFLYTALTENLSLHGKTYPSNPSEHAVYYFERHEALSILRSFPKREEGGLDEFIADGFITSIIPHPRPQEDDVLFGLPYRRMDRISQFRQSKMRRLPKESMDKREVLMRFHNLVETFDQFECILDRETENVSTAMVKLTEHQRRGEKLFNKLKDAESLISDVFLQLGDREIARRCMDFIFDVREIEQDRESEITDASLTQE